MFTESQILRYSRQLLLTAVGPHGQQRLGEVGARVAGEGAAQWIAAAYLAAAGVPIEGPSRSLASGEDEGFLFSPQQVGKALPELLQASLEDLNPDALVGVAYRGVLAEVPAAFSGATPWLALGAHGAGAAILFRQTEGCADCFHRTLAALEGPVVSPLAVRAGATAALIWERCVLGGELRALGGVCLDPEGGLLPLPLRLCPEHDR